MKCPSCHGEVTEGARFCRHCGTPLHQTPDPVESSPSSLDAGATMIDVGPVVTPSSQDELEAGQLFHNRYLIEGKLGQGGMGQVYRAMDQITKDTVVLKVLRPELLTSEAAIARFQREGALTRSLHHTNIVALYDVNVVDGLTYVTMEYLEGRSLREFILELRRSGEDLGFEVARAITAQILDGLSAAHEAGIVHRDLKPENVMIKGDPRSGSFQLRILDFGIARALASDSQLTVAGAVLGTEAYMAPEQITGADVVGPQADLYSVAVVLYELLVQVIPRGHWELPSKIRPELPAALDDVLDHGLNPHPKRRYQNAAEFDSALAAVTAGKKAKDKGAEDQQRPHIDLPHNAQEWAGALLGGGLADAQKSAQKAMRNMLGGEIPDTREQTVDLPLATYGQRVKAGMIDFLTVFGGLLVVFVVIAEEFIGYMSTSDEEMLGLLYVFTCGIAALAYFGTYHFYSGQTPGKKKVGIKVVGPQGKKLNQNQATLRALGYLISLACFGWGLWAMRKDPNGQSWHDKMAGTYVIQVKR